MSFLTTEESSIIISILKEHKDRLKEGRDNLSSGRLEAPGTIRGDRLILGIEKSIKQLDLILLKLKEDV